MAQLITPTDDARQTFTVILDNQKVRLNLSFIETTLNDVPSGWYCDLILISDSEEVIVQGQRLVSTGIVGNPTISDFSGAIIPVPVTNPAQELTTLDAWSTTHNLVFFTLAELQEEGLL